MSGAHKTALRIYGANGSWQGDVILYATDEGKARLVKLLDSAGLYRTKAYTYDKPAVLVLADLRNVEDSALSDAERMRKHAREDKESWRA